MGQIHHNSMKRIQSRYNIYLKNVTVHPSNVTYHQLLPPQGDSFFTLLFLMWQVWMNVVHAVSGLVAVTDLWDSICIHMKSLFCQKALLLSHLNTNFSLSVNGTGPICPVKCFCEIYNDRSMQTFVENKWFTIFIYMLPLNSLRVYILNMYQNRTRIVQSVWRLAMGWLTEGSEFEFR
jgi:hypothetical protein